MKTADYFRYDGDLIGSDGKYYVPDWAAKAFEDGVLFYADTQDSPSELFIKTSNGTQHVNVGDCVCYNDGELYSCK